MSQGSRRAEHVADTRAALVDAARQLFAERGYAGTGTEDIVAVAHVTRGALYHHFRDKADLFAEVMQTVAAEVAEEIVVQQSGTWTDDMTPLEQVQAGLQAFLDVCVGTDFRRIVLVEGPAVLGNDSWESLVERHGLGILSTWLSQAVDAGEIDDLPVPALARLLIGVVAEASLYIARSTDPPTARQEIGVTVERLLEGLRKGAAPV